MHITPLAADSMGSRSMATLVEAGDVHVLIDPGVGMGPMRYGLSPHPMEEWTYKKHLERIELYAASAQVIVMSSFHPDHVILNNLSLYENKILLVKNPNQDIARDVRKQAFDFIRQVRDVAKEIQYADRRSFEIEGAIICFSPPVPYGLMQEEGFALSVSIKAGDDSFLFSSHIHGWDRSVPMDFIVEQNPNILYLDGPITYLYGDESKEEYLAEGLTLVRSVLERTKIHMLIIDHHLLRDLHWESKITPLRRFVEEKGIVMQTAAEMRGENIHMLEARRQLLYEEDAIL